MTAQQQFEMGSAPGALRPQTGAEPARPRSEPAKSAPEDTGAALPTARSWPLRLTGEAISILAMALATLALGAGLYLQAGLAPWAAAATAVAVYVCMLAVHALMPRHYVIDDTPESYEAGEARGAAVVPPPQRAPARTVRPAQGGPDARRNGPVHAPHPDLSASSPSPPSTGPIDNAGAVRRPPGQLGGRPAEPDPPANLDPSGGAPAVRQVPPAVAGVTEPPNGSGAPTAGRPAVTSPVAPKVPPSAPVVPPAAASGAVSSRARAPRESDVEMIQALIKKLADEVNAAGAAPAQGAAADKRLAERAIEQSVDALKTTAGSMRDQDAAAHERQCAGPNASEKQPADQNLEGGRETGRSPEVSRRLSALAEALALGRVEVLLDPIVDFGVGRPRHFEVSLRLRDGKGAVLDTSEQLAGLSGTGMLPRLDGARIANASQIAMRFGQRADCLFSSVSGEALVANSFLDGVVDAYRERDSFAGQLIMTFSQQDVRDFGRREWQALRDFASLGFRYAISDVTDLDMDFGDLAQRGFTFAKLDADVFLRGLPAGNDIFVPASDICKHLAGVGLGVIVGGMSDEQTAAKVFGFGVLLGQGTLFGGAKAVKRELLAQGKKTQAA